MHWLIPAALFVASIPAQALQIELKTASSVRAEVRFPKNKFGTRLPVLLIFGGFEHAAEVLDLVSTTSSSSDQNIVLASFDYPFTGSRKFEFPGTLLEGDRLRQTIRETRAGIRELVSRLREHPDIDPERIGILGASLGAPFAIQGAADDPSLSPLVVVHGFADPASTIAHRLKQIWRPRLGPLGFLAIPLAALSGNFLEIYLDLPVPETLTPLLGPEQRVLLIQAKDDTFIPEESRTRLASALKTSSAKVSLIEMPGDHLQPGSQERIREIFGKVLQWSRETGFVD